MLLDAPSGGKKGKATKLCHLWFHTGFVQSNFLCFEKMVIDKACKDKEHRVFQPSFRIELFLHKEGHRRAGERLYSSSPANDPTPARGYRGDGEEDGERGGSAEGKEKRIIGGEGAEERAEEECDAAVSGAGAMGGGGTDEETNGDHS